MLAEIGGLMDSIDVDDLDDDVMERLRVRAERHGRSVEDEARAIVTDAVRDQELPTTRS